MTREEARRFLLCGEGRMVFNDDRTVLTTRNFTQADLLNPEECYAFKCIADNGDYQMANLETALDFLFCGYDPVPVFTEEELQTVAFLTTIGGFLEWT